MAASSAPAPAAAIPDHALPAAAAAEPRRTWPALALVLAALLATGGGYIAFHRDPPAPVVTPSARFEDRLARAFARLNQVRISARGQMAAATDAGARKVQARRVANAYDTTALALHRLTPAAAQRAAVALAVEKLLRAAEAYNDLAKSGATPGTRGLVTKSHVVAVREAAVQRAVAQMTGNAAN
jgi:hypothetical protein